MWIRTVLYTPGDRPERIEKALTAGDADVVVADLEDAVMPENKAAAQVATCEVMQRFQGQTGSLRAIRIRSYPSSEAMADLEAVMESQPNWIVVPKVEDAKSLEMLDHHLTQLESEHSIEAGSTRIMAILESPLGILNAQFIAGASPRLAALAFGAEDLAAAMNLRRSPSNWEVQTPRSMVALAAKAYGLQAIDQVCVAVKDAERTAEDMLQGRAIGYDGKMVLHPIQVQAVHDALAPTADEVHEAQRLLDAVEASGIGSGGVIAFEGRMIDVPVIEQARRLVATQKEQAS